MTKFKRRPTWQALLYGWAFFLLGGTVLAFCPVVVQECRRVAARFVFPEQAASTHGTNALTNSPALVAESGKSVPARTIAPLLRTLPSGSNLASRYVVPADLARRGTIPSALASTPSHATTGGSLSFATLTTRHVAMRDLAAPSPQTASTHPLAASGTTYTWTGNGAASGTTNWSSQSNWTSRAVAGNVSVQAGGTLTPGQAGAGKLALGGNLTLTGTATAAFVLSGTMGNTQADVAGQINLGNQATLSLSLAAGTLPTVGQKFFLLDSESVSLVAGGFANAPATGSIFFEDGFTYQINYLDADPNDPGHTLLNDVSVTILSVPEPGTWALLIAAGVGLLLRCQPRRL